MPAEVTTWPEALVSLATIAFVAFLVWRITN